MGILGFIFLFIVISSLSKNNQQNRNRQNNTQQRYRQNGNPNRYNVNRQAPYNRQNPYQQNPYANRLNPYQQNMNPYQTNNPYSAERLSNYGQIPMPNTGNYQNATINNYGLPSSSRQRKKIVKKFSDTFGLNLSDNDVKAIVDSSYMNSVWSREICYMNQKYDNVYSWFSTGNAWLKAYLYAFPIQQISSDFNMQEQIVYNTYNQVFSDVLCRPNITVAEAIYLINSKYFTQFDDNTFMIAYRYMEQKGKRFPLSVQGVVQGTTEIDDLLSKYEQKGTPSH